jgi:hypothetical protein
VFTTSYKIVATKVGQVRQMVAVLPFSALIAHRSMNES